MPVETFYDMYSFMLAHPHMMGPSSAVEFSFLAYFLTFESVFVDEASGQKVLDNWRAACAEISSSEPCRTLSDVGRHNSKLREMELRPDDRHVLTFVGEKMAGVLEEIQKESSKLTDLPNHEFSGKIGTLLDFIRPFFEPATFFNHKAMAFEGFLGGLISAYEYLLFGTFTRATSGTKMRKVIEGMPYYVSRTLSTIHLSPEEDWKRRELYDEEQLKQSFDQVREGLRRIAEKTTTLRQESSRHFLGFP